MLNDILKGKRLILASKSPRRQQLLRELGVDFEVRANGDDEELYPNDLSMTEIPVYLAQHKAKSLLGNLRENDILITSDTIVWCKGQVIGKPNDEQDAFKILSLLSGNKHIGRQASPTGHTTFGSRPGCAVPRTPIRLRYPALVLVPSSEAWYRSFISLRCYAAAWDLVHREPVVRCISINKNGHSHQKGHARL